MPMVSPTYSGARSLVHVQNIPFLKDGRMAHNHKAYSFKVSYGFN